MRKNIKKIFLSHSSKDEKIVSYFMDDILIGVLEFSYKEIFYTSGDGTKIESGENWRDSIKDNLMQSELIILFITPNYKQSEVCLNEMGAAWVSGKNVLQLIIDPITYSNVGVIMDVSQIEKLNDETSLDRVRDKIQDIFKDKEFKIKSDRWTSKKQEFLLKVENYIEENPFSTPISNENYYSMEKKYLNLKSLNKELLKKNELLTDTIEKLKELKDKEQVKAIVKDERSIEVEEKFEKIKRSIKDITKRFKPVIVTIIYNNYCNKNLPFDYQLNKVEIEQAIAREYINDEFEVNWEDYNISELDALLSELNQLLKENEELCIELREEYKIKIDITNLDFWEQVIEIKMSYN